MAALGAGAVYVGGVFPCAFILGTVRVLILAPWWGELPAVLLEIPLVLMISWFIARWCMRRFHVRMEAAPLLLMGWFAFSLLMLVEFVLSITVFGNTPGAYLASFGTLAGVVGLGGQLGFAMIPLLHRSR